MRERRSNRLTGYNYSAAGMYFITICTRNRDILFGEIRNGIMELNETGKIALNCWQEIPDHFPVASINEFVIMPDHVHGIIEISGSTAPVAPWSPCPVGNADLRSLQGPWGIDGIDDRTKMTIPKIIHGYKSSVTRIINHKYNMNFKWQKSYHDHIIRNDDELNRIRRYIRSNPGNWKFGKGDQADISGTVTEFIF